jgi:hypothetical protein
LTQNIAVPSTVPLIYTKSAHISDCDLIAI